MAITSNNKYRTMKQRIRLTESQLYNVIKKCVNECLNSKRKKIIKESEENFNPQSQIVSELADELGVDANSISELNYSAYGNGKYYEVDGMEYLVYETYDDAYDAAVEANYSLIVDEQTLPNLNLEEFMSEEWVEELAEEEADYYTNEAIENEEISEEERDDYYQEKYNEIVNDPIYYLESLFGKKELPNYLIKYNALDFDAMAEKCVEIDGVAHLLASYDGNEIDLPSGAVAFRTN